MSQVNVEDEVLVKVENSIENYAEVRDGARRATESEKGLSIRAALRLHWRAILWSAILSASLIMEGFDNALLGSFYALPQFAQKYGVPVGETSQYTVTAPWQTGLSNAVIIGELIGLLMAGLAVDRFGYKKTVLTALLAMIAFIFIPVFAQNIETLLAGEILQGLPWGAFQTLTTTYAADVMPVPLRPYLTAYVNLCWVIGQLIAAGTLRGVLSLQGQWAYRLPFALQWIWPVLIIPGAILAPESPWWLVRHAKFDEARKALDRLAPRSSAEIEDNLSYMIYTNAVEKAMVEGTSYLDCFRGTDLRRTEITSVAWIVQLYSGLVFSGFSTLFLVQAGLSADNSFSLSVGNSALGVVGTMSSWFLMSYVGRRKIYLFGLVILCGLMTVVGALGWETAKGNAGASWAVGALLLVFTFVYDCTIGPVAYTLVAEIPSTRLRAKTATVARAAYNIACIVALVLLPRMINPLEWNWGAKGGLFWAGTALLCFIWTFFRCPEAMGRTPAELDVLFENKIPAWRFANTDVHQFETHDNHVHHSQVSAKLEEAEEKQEIAHIG